MKLTYKLLFSSKAEKQLRQLDRYQERLIVGWLKKNVDDTLNPRAHGKGLTGNLSGYWRYRVGDYRIVCIIYDDVCEIVAVNIGHRSKIYLG